ncbi:hypothetical protein L4D06_04765 [Enterovibrio makurazakiensis]|uniref:DNA gyrase subunit B n=1 Tax=Enterovibrio gelatinilyticus TaxID=2899819 RepID=A0ABT5QV38_9GAMM|nr:hypothetical protein [Enterovibrio sp. ZSDZ42]MDD1791870.1 hypothetical protein [Enterovibrio sp. ZSDZ42]
MRSLSAVAGMLLLAYPLAVYAGLSYWGAAPLALVLIVLFACRIVSSRRSKSGPLKHLAILTGTIGIALASLGYLFKQHDWFLYYPVVVNAVMLAIFAHSLSQPQSIVEKLARLQDPDLPPSGVSYTRKVTKVWCLFFLLNGSIAWLTCFMPLSNWTLYNGLLSYLAAGTLFAVEYLVRKKVQAS